MNRSSTLSVFVLGVVLTGACTPAGQIQVDSPSAMRTPLVDDAFLDQYAATLGFQLGRPSSFTITPDGSTVLFLRSEPRGLERSLYAVDVERGEERLLLTAEQVLQGAEEELSEEEQARRERLRLAARGITSYELSKDGTTILVPLSGRLFLVTRETGSVRELPSDGGYANDAHLSPDGRLVACVRNDELYVIDVAEGSQRRITHTASEFISNGLPEFVAQEEMGRYQGYWWSPDSTKLVYQETNTEEVERWYRYDPMHPEQAPSGAPYPRPGMANAQVRLGVISMRGGTTRWLSWDRERFPYVATVRWSTNAPLTLVVQDRWQRRQQILTADPVTGSTELLWEETDEAWINLDQSMPRWLEDGQSLLWSTERDGGWAIELRARSGELIRRIAPDVIALGQVDYQHLLHVDESRNLVFVQASRKPTESHVWQLPLQGDMEARRLSEAGGTHTGTFGTGSDVWVHYEESLTVEPTWKVRRGESPAVGQIQSVAEKPPFSVNVELVTVGARDYYAQLVRPRDFRPGATYPVLVSVYGGPHVNVVQDEQDRNLMRQYFADHGFVVVSMDGRGTPRRGRDWERSIVGNLIEIPLADQIEALQALFERFPELDSERVGIYGWSFGGYFSAIATMLHPTIFHAGVVGAPVADWRDYDTHYTERYLGLPDVNQAGYEASSALTHAPNLERPLLIMHGTADDNVYFTHAIKMSDALFRAGRDHDFVPLPGATHMVADPTMLRARQGRILRFFERHLQD